MRRAAFSTLLAMLMVSSTVGLAVATPSPADGADPADGHKITICHATRSLSNPYVEIEIDVAAWNDPSDPMHHGDHHTRTKQGITWSDYVKVEGEPCALPDDPPPTGNCSGLDAEIVVEIGGNALKWEDPLTRTVTGLNIPAGEYEVILGSSDERNTSQVQDNEQWRAQFVGDTTAVYSGYADDLTDGPSSVEEATNVGSVTLTETVTTIVAEHWSFINGDGGTSNSVVAECVGLTPRD